MFKQAVQQYWSQHSHAILQNLINFVAIPNNVYQLPDIQRNAEYLKSIMSVRGINVRELARPSKRPMIFGEIITDPNLPTLLFYSHYDGVPVELDQWHSDPYTPVLRKTSPTHPDHDWTPLPLDTPTH